MKPGVTITLPKQPDGYQFEEAVAAKIRSIGYFTECRTILDHDGRDVLELDVVASPSSADCLNRILVDAKKDTAGFSDIFKVYGWRVFLKIPRGSVIHGTKVDASALTAFGEICPKLNVFPNYFDLATGGDFASVPVINHAADVKLRGTAANIGWYQLIAERLALESFHKTRKQFVGEKVFDRVREYRRACNRAFFESDPFKRIEVLYTAFQADSHITDACVNWEAARSGKAAPKIWDEIRDTPAHPWIQHVLSLEIRARLVIIKNGLDAALTIGAMGNNMDAFWSSTAISSLPQNFRTGFEQLSQHQYRTAIPYLLQLYFDLFGGFLLDDQDRAQLAALAGVPAPVVEDALVLYDVFYPIDKGWRQKSKELVMTKMIPAFSRGVGAFFRHESRSLKNYEAIAPSMAWLVIKWHNATIDLLAPELEKKEPAKTK